MKAVYSLILALFCVTALTGCGGKLAETGFTAVTGLHQCGTMSVSYPDGKTKIKRLKPDSSPKDVDKVAKNLFKPARFVETKKGGTLTFPDGETVIFQDVPKK